MTTLIINSPPDDDPTETLSIKWFTGVLLGRLTDEVSKLEINSDSYRLAQSWARISPRG